MMRRVAEFSGVELLTYAILDNHFHLLVLVPKRHMISDETLIQRLHLLYSRAEVKMVEEELANYIASENMIEADQLRDRYLRRMYSLPEFMKTLKQRFAIWYNATHNRRGHLWDDRYKSILIEGTSGALDRPSALWTIAQYIELNAVRAGIVTHAAKYRWCGFAAAQAGSKAAQSGICQILGGPLNWLLICPIYGGRLTENDGPPGATQLSLHSHRVRYFVDGVMLGSAAFVENMFNQRRDLFCASRKTAARKMKGADWNGLCTLRDFRKQVIEPS